MPKILHIEASPRGDRSASTRAARAFFAAMKGRTPSARIDHLNLWTTPLPSFDGDALEAKYQRLGGLPLSPGQARAWATIEAYVERLRAADGIVISTPLWNFGVPYRLKHYIDLVTQPGLSFAFDPASGYKPLLAPTPTVVVLSSAGDYSGGSSFGRPDLASGYLRAALGFIGLDLVDIVPVAPTAGVRERIDAGAAHAAMRLAALADSFPSITP